MPSWGGSLFEALMPLLVLDELTLLARQPGTERDGAHANSPPLRAGTPGLSRVGSVAQFDPGW
ncbi:MAG: hypothetical protein MZV65_47460 [Chromatiales bacterium]|nr:hypothetical protein [Chromatiales bacterium]